MIVVREAFINKSFSFIQNNKSLNHYQEIKIKYGLEVMYHTITKTLVVFFISLCLGVLKENVLITLFYSPLRSAGHGIHSRNNLVCWISSILIYSIVGLTAKYLMFSTSSLLPLFILFFLSFALWAPSDTKGRPLIHKKDRIRLKIISLLLLSSYLPVAIYIKSLRSIVICASLIETFNINPFIYFVSNSSRNNYKNYK